MLYYSNEARISHIKRITELIKVIDNIPVDSVGGYQNVCDIIKYLIGYRTLILKELEENK